MSRSRLILALSCLTVILYAVAGVSINRLLPIFQPAQPVLQALGVARTPTPFRPLRVTPTPFQPLHPTSTPAPRPTAKPPVNPWDFHGINFYDETQAIAIQVQPPAGSSAAAFTIRFVPGRDCVFGDGRACVSAYTTGAGRFIFITIHSGVGGEGQSFRHAAEGTGLNQPAYDLIQIQAALAALAGAEITLTQGQRSAGGLALPVAARVPAAGLEPYFSAPVSEALALAARYQPELEPFLSPDRPTLIIETCGWKHFAEAWEPGVSGSTGSVYLAVIQAP